MNLFKVLLFSKLATTSSKSLRGDADERDLRNRIIGGDKAVQGRYSYAVSLQDDEGHFCGGSLIAPDVVLSAAHCMQEKAGYKAIVGRHDLKTTEGDVVIVKDEIAHPDYDWGTTDNDFMILVLERPTTENVNLVEVSSNVVPVGQTTTVMGWGDTHPSDDVLERSEVLLETEVFVVSNEECEQSSGMVGGTVLEDGTVVGQWPETYEGQITDNMVCAEKEGAGVDACQGDSGGPLVIRSGSGDVQVGVVSWGVSCAHKDFPGVYARISAQYQWIRQHVCDHSSAPPASFGCNTRAIDLSGGGNVQAKTTAEWTTISKEEFTFGYGMFSHGVDNAKHYTNTMGRSGVVRVAGGAGGSLTSNIISLEHNPFSRLRVAFSFYAIGLESDDDKLCVDYELDDGSVAAEKCWSGLLAFESDRWYDDMSFEFSASSAKNMKIRFSVKGDEGEDDVLIDSVAIEGQ
ncbi:hypothetical protein ACHAWF_009195 [Thalassiosira exigua]